MFRAKCLDLGKPLKDLKLRQMQLLKLQNFYFQKMLHFFLWKDFCQDEIKQHFSNQRQFGPCSDNPDLQMFKYNGKAIHVSCTNGNTRGRYDK